MNQVDSTTLVTHRCVGDGSDYDFENIVPTYHILEQDQESVCAYDNRIKVTSTNALPFKAICKLHMKAEDGTNLIGTGWLTHGNKLYTAGHCVYSHRHGGWMTNIIVVPGKSGFSEPYGRYTATELLTTRGWYDEESRRYDMGAIKLAASVDHSDFLVPTLSDVDVVTICGYPADRDASQFQYKMQDTVKNEQGRFFYNIDTFGGQSGSPLLRNSNVSIGIHNYGGCENSGSDLYEDFIEFVENW